MLHKSKGKTGALIGQRSALPWQKVKHIWHIVPVRWLWAVNTSQTLTISFKVLKQDEMCHFMFIDGGYDSILISSAIVIHAWSRCNKYQGSSGWQTCHSCLLCWNYFIFTHVAFNWLLAYLWSLSDLFWPW